MPSGFRIDPSFHARFAESVELRRELHETAEKAAEAAQGVAHRIMPDKGRKAQIQAVTSEDGEHIVNFDHGGHLDEWGSRNNPPYAPVRRGLNEVGLPLKEE